jgi:hypothetical protein
MVGMSLSVSAVAAASSAWVWIPDDATVVETSEYTILRPPDYFDYPLAVMQFRPTGPLGEAVDRVLERARSFGVPEVRWQARFDDPAELAGELTARGATVLLVLDVLASALEGGGPVLPPPAVDVTVRWVLAARLSYSVAYGATVALVKAKADTSGPILRKAGFLAFGREPIYSVPLG